MGASTLELARENHKYRLKTALRVLAAEFEPAGYVMAAACYRVLAACALLLDSDTSQYRVYLCSAGQARLDFLRGAAGAGAIRPNYLCCSKDLGFACAVAAEDWQTAKEIATRSQTSHDARVEYEDDFLFFHFMHTLLLDPSNAAAAGAIIARWERVLEGATSGHFEVCKCIQEADQKSYPLAFESLVESRQRRLDVYEQDISADRELLAVERGLFIDAVAVAKLARVRGLQLQGGYAGAPELALETVGRAPPPVTAWRTPV
jgi:hypothetical protein